MRRDSIDDAAEEIAEMVVSDLPATPPECREALPDDIQDLIAESPAALTEESSDEIENNMSIESILSDTPLEEYLD